MARKNTFAALVIAAVIVCVQFPATMGRQVEVMEDDLGECSANASSKECVDPLSTADANPNVGTKDVLIEPKNEDHLTNKTQGNPSNVENENLKKPQNSGRPKPQKPGRPNAQKPGKPKPQKPGRPNAQKPGRPQKPGKPNPQKPGRPNAQKPKPQKPGKPNHQKPQKPKPPKPGPPQRPTDIDGVECTPLGYSCNCDCCGGYCAATKFSETRYCIRLERDDPTPPVCKRRPFISGNPTTTTTTAAPASSNPVGSIPVVGDGISQQSGGGGSPSVGNTNSTQGVENIPVVGGGLQQGANQGGQGLGSGGLPQGKPPNGGVPDFKENGKSLKY